MNLRDLEYFIEVAKTKHFGKAAKNCFVSQPTLSMQLKKLEEELGIDLFERNNKKVFLTQTGQKILPKAKSILQESKEIKNIAKSSKDPFSAELKIGAFPTLAPYFFPKAVSFLAKEIPNLKCFLVEEKTDTLIQQLKEGEIDIAFLAMPINEVDLESKVLFEENFLFAVSTKHKFSSRKQLTAKDLKEQELLLLDEGHCLREQSLEVCSLNGADEQKNFRASSLETLRQMVASNIGATLIPQIAIDKSEDIKYIPFKQPSPKRIIALVYRKTFYYKELVNLLEKKLKDLMSTSPQNIKKNEQR